MLRQLLIFLHLAGGVVWVGGMFFAYFCLRPAAAQLLEPPQRLPLWVATFDRFFRLVAVAVALILLSGFGLFAQTGFAYAPLGWHIMMALGLAMAGVFAYVYLVLYPRLSRHCEAAAWPAAAAALNGIRQMVALNLILAALAIVAAVTAR
jgi:uncharacterized membrane protein